MKKSVGASLRYKDIKNQYTLRQVVKIIAAILLPLTIIELKIYLKLMYFSSFSIIFAV